MSRSSKPPADPSEPFDFPGVVIVDSREQKPFEFRNLQCDARQHRRPLRIATVVGTLKQGDYSLAGYESSVAYERKSHADLVNTIGQNRERFVRELERLNGLQAAGVVVEADWLTIFREPPSHSKLTPKVIFRSILAWAQRFPRVHWWMMPDRRLAEVATFRLLERFWRDVHEPRKVVDNGQKT